VGAKKTTAAKKKTAAKKTTTMARRADFGTPIDAYIEKHKGEPREILEALRALVVKAMPKAESMMKWGMPVFMLGNRMAAALRVTKAGVGLIMNGDPSAFKDPKGLLDEGAAKNMRQIKVAKLAELPKKEIEGWLKVAAKP
jgi:hypothetical protein